MKRKVDLKLCSFALAALTGFGGLKPTVALSETIVVTNLNMFRDLRGINDVGITAGDLLQYGANVAGGSAGVTLSGFYAPQFLTDAASPCAPLALNANFCSNDIAYANELGIPRIAQPWSFTFKRGSDSLTVAGPSVLGISSATPFFGGPFDLPGAVPFPMNVTISNGATPTTPIIEWVLPKGLAPDGFRVAIYDKTRIRENGAADVIHNDTLAANATSYTIPSVLDKGVDLLTGGNYSINFQIIETRGHVPFTGNASQILSRSSSFFSFSPLASPSPPFVYLPEVGTDTDPSDNRGAPYNFKITHVGPESVTFIDPIVAIGYDYQIGIGDPNFESVLLPDVGDGLYDIFNCSGALLGIGQAGVSFGFGSAGLDCFRVRGIELPGLDPANVSAFVTGLRFVLPGAFTGTMTPITTEIPLPATLPLLALALASLGWSRRKK